MLLNLPPCNGPDFKIRSSMLNQTCCYSLTAAPQQAPLKEPGVELLKLLQHAALRLGSPPIGVHSFSRSLIDEPRYWRYDPPLSVAMLHNKVLSRIKCWKPRFGARGDHERRRTPIYMVLANERKQRSIDLLPKDPAIIFVGFVKSWGLFNDKPLT